MHYPFWYVPGMTSPMLIATIGVLHMFAAMYAVGGAILLAILLRRAYREQDTAYSSYLHEHAWFFVLVTVVFGAITGIGIWWTIGLASPLATEDLIHIFVFIWGIEYVAFVVEVISAFVFFYYWDRLDRKTHLTTVGIYAGAAWISLALITPITAFQLNNHDWRQSDGLWTAFWNPQAGPQILARTGASLLLAALYVLLHASFKLRDNEHLRNLVGEDTARLSVVGVVLTIAGGALWMLTLPPSGQAALTGAAVLNILVFVIFIITGGVVFMMYYGPYKHPNWVTPGFALLFAGMGIGATATGEFIREASRKPYIVYDRILGSQIRPEAIPRLRRIGYLNGGVWTKVYIRMKYPRLMTHNRIDESKFLTLPLSDQRDIGRTIFMNHCNDCHAVEGYSPVAQLTRGWTRPMILQMVEHLPENHYFMPPWSGTVPEAKVLTEYLYSVRHPFPKNMYPGIELKGGRQ